MRFLDRMRRRLAVRAVKIPARAWLLLGLSLCLTLAAWRGADELARSAAAQEFQFRHAEVLTSLRTRLAAYRQILHGGLGLLQVTREVGPEDWHRYVASLALAEEFPGIQGVGYADWIRRGDAPEQAVITRLEPMDERNRRAVGFDMASEEVRRAAMERARDTGQATVSGVVTLIQEGARKGGPAQPGFLMYVPHYAGMHGADDGTPATAEERRAALRGFVYAPFRMGDFMRAIEADELKDLRLQLLSTGAGGTPALLYDSRPGEPWPEEPYRGLAATAAVAFPGVDWTARFAALPPAAAATERVMPPAILAGGIVASLLAFAAVATALGLRRMEDENASLGRVIERASAEIYILDARTLCIRRANRGARASLGYSSADLRRQSLPDLQPGMDAGAVEALLAPLRAGERAQVTYRTVQRRRDGSEYPVEVSLQLHGTARPPVVLALVQDLTERRRAEEALERALADTRELLAEKDTLLREIHHRVKNNLQVIWSLIRLEAAEISDPAIRHRIETVARRISVLGQIHQQLYGTDNLARVDIGEYLRQLSASLERLHEHQGIALEVAAEPLTCDIEHAIPIGLIANELISNSLEHAFPTDRRGRVVVRLHRRGQGAELTVADDGVGAGPQAPAGLGLRLVEALAGQLGTEPVVERARGTRTTLALPASLFAA
ncbi:MAG TPA: CHASE domain-containing protein [Azospirillaceae bacterium]|nr:CHASE domain-containing protein [Azospirillaceae bacterium]